MGKNLCDSCKYKYGEKQCNSFDVMAMTMIHTHKTMPEFKQLTDEEMSFLNKLGFCFGYKESEKNK